MLRRTAVIVLAVVMAVVLVGSPRAWPVEAQGGVTLALISNLNVRVGPGTDFLSFTTLPRGQQVVVEARNQVGDWVLVHTTDGGVRGWLASRYLIWGDADINAVAESDEVVENVSVPSSNAASGAARSSNAIDLYQGPNTNLPILVSLPRQTNLSLEARNGDGRYILAHSDSGQRGWVIASLLVGAGDLSGLPVSEETISTQDVYDGFLARLEALPEMPSISNHTREIFRTGLSYGLRRNVFSKIGDCHTEHLAFLVPIGAHEYDLGPYGSLQGTIDYFNVSPRDGVTDPFVNESMAASSAFSAAAVQDQTWSDPNICRSGESPLACEYRVLRPSVALIMFGSVDMQIYSAADFGYYLRQVVDETIRRGIVPVLFTYPIHPDYNWQTGLQFNAIIMDIAEQEQIPVVNFWKTLRPLPNYGLQGDNFHLSYSGDRFMNFNGDQNNWGMVQYNLVALQTLQVLQQNLLRR